MEIKTPLKFETFNDGYCSIYSVGKNEELIIKYTKLGFGNQNIGSKRFYTAAAANLSLESSIRIPQKRDILAIDFVVKNGFKHQIQQVQHIDSTNPRITVLALKQLEMFTEVI